MPCHFSFYLSKCAAQRPFYRYSVNETTKRNDCLLSVVFFFVSKMDIVLVMFAICSQLKAGNQNVGISLCCCFLVTTVNLTYVCFTIVFVRTQTGTSMTTAWWRRWNVARWIRWLLFLARRASSPRSSMWKVVLREYTHTHTHTLHVWIFVNPKELHITNTKYSRALLTACSWPCFSDKAHADRNSFTIRSHLLKIVSPLTSFYNITELSL